ncbi:hypothetical protein Sango_1638400 [Sesamum angolense]|uniref:Uncharacterized protein n=1 Tax=Sesamum angolense TaxID=2727404 RepID=A0AAE1WK64_9LAMI|nr:hypothetical protein Sango_1638400 [Sesamum angolense]
MNMEDKRDMQMIIKEHINLGLIEPGISAYSSPGFLEHIVEKIRNFPDILKDKKQLQSFLGVVNFAGIFIKDLAKYRKDFRPLLKETESTKWKWEEIHTQRVRELKQVCNNLPKLAIPQDKDELHLRENLEELNNKFGRLAVNAQVAGQIQRADRDTVQIAIRTTMVASTSLWNDLQEPIRKASSSEMTNELKKHDAKHALRVQDSRPVAADSSTACTRPSSDSGETATNESQGVKTSDDSSQPSTSGVKEGEISLMPMTGTSKAKNMNYLLHLLLLGSGAVYDSWQNNPHLKRGDILELKFISAAPEMAGKGSHPAFHFIKLQRPDMVAFNRIKATTEEAPLVSAISEDNISTRRAWGLWVCLTEMDKVKKHVRKKRMLIWENKLPATEVTRMKAFNMLHVGQWHNHVCPCCEKQEKPLFGTKIRVTQKKPEPKPDKAAVVWLEEVRKTEDLGYPESRRSNQEVQNDHRID